MKILFIGTVDLIGGAAKVSWEIKKKLETKGFQTNHLVGTKTTQDNGVEVLYQPFIFDSPVKKATGKNIKQWGNFFYAFLFSNDINIGSVKKIVNHPLVREADIIHCHNLHGDFFNLDALVEISKNKPVVWTLHDMWSLTGHCAHSFSCNRWQNGCGNCPNLKTYRAQAWDNTANIIKKKKAIYQRSKLNIIAPSKWLYEKLEKSILKNQPKLLIYNGVEAKTFKISSTNKARKKLKLPTNKKIILFIANGGKNNIYKGGEYLDFLVKKYHSNPEILFICIGQERQNLPQEVNIIYLPFIKDPEKLSLYFSASDIFLFTSLAENCPLVVLEAMSTGTPILSFNVGGVKELIKHKRSGYVVKYKDKVDLVNGFSWLLNLSQKRINDIKKYNKERAIKKFSMQTMVQKHLKLYRKLLR